MKQLASQLGDVSVFQEPMRGLPVHGDSSVRRDFVAGPLPGPGVKALDSASRAMQQAALLSQPLPPLVNPGRVYLLCMGPRLLLPPTQVSS